MSITNPQIVFLTETKVKLKKIDNLKRRLKYDNLFGVDADRNSGGLGLFW